jgi:predicted transcriptional regulator
LTTIVVTAMVTTVVGMTAHTLGARELALLRHIADAGGATVGEVAETFGAPRNLARSTVLTMMERLRKKGFLNRRLAGGVYRYQARASSDEVTRGAIRRFVDRNLGGSVAPFVAYLSETTALTDAELGELEELVARLQSAKKKESR